MPGTQPPPSADEPPHTARTIAVATTEMMWAVAIATTRASVASAAHGLALWSRLLGAPIVGTWSVGQWSVGPWSLAASHSAVSADAAATSDASAQPPAKTAPAGAPGDEAAAFASYRSSGGHAAAQVITHH